MSVTKKLKTKRYIFVEMTICSTVTQLSHVQNFVLTVFVFKEAWASWGSAYHQPQSLEFRLSLGVLVWAASGRKGQRLAGSAVAPTPLLQSWCLWWGAPPGNVSTTDSGKVCKDTAAQNA